MALEFISGLWAGIFLLVVLLYTLKIGFARSLVRAVPLAPRMTVAILLILGFVAGGFAFWQGTITGGLASIGTETTTEISSFADMPVEKCVYSTGVGIASNVTVRADSDDPSVVFIDVDENAGWEDLSLSEININFTVDRGGSVHEDAIVHIVTNTPTFTSEQSTTDASSYTIISSSSTASSVWTGKDRLDINLDEGTSGATTADAYEENYMAFTEGIKTLNLQLVGEVDSTAFSNLDNYSMKKIPVYQRVNGVDTEICTIVINKVP